MLDILKIVLDHQRFAEAKNAALLTFNAVLLMAAPRLFPGNTFFDLAHWDQVFAVITFLACEMAAFILIILSFYPKLNLTIKESKRAEHIEWEKLDLVFFGDLANIPLNRCKEFVSFVKKGDANDYEIGVARQIVKNSLITYNKFHLFSWALYISSICYFALLYRYISIFWTG